MSRPEHPIFGRASESDEADDRAYMLETQLLRFADAIQTEMDRLDDFLPAPPFVSAQEAEDWSDDLMEATSVARLAMREMISKVSKARSNRMKVKA